MRRPGRLRLGEQPHRLTISDVQAGASQSTERLLLCRSSKALDAFHVRHQGAAAMGVGFSRSSFEKLSESGFPTRPIRDSDGVHGDCGIGRIAPPGRQ